MIFTTAASSSGGGGGGATNVVAGTLTTGSTKSVQTFPISYSGTGYPIYFGMEVEGGSDSMQSELCNRGFVTFAFVKAAAGTAPDYTGSDNDAGWLAGSYKSSNSTATSRSNATSTTAKLYGSTPGTTSTACIKYYNKSIVANVTDNTNTEYGLIVGKTYRYVILFSS